MNKISKKEMYEQYANLAAKVAINYYKSWNHKYHSHLDEDDFKQEALMNFWNKLDDVDASKHHFEIFSWVSTITERYLSNLVRREQTQKRFHVKEHANVDSFTVEDDHNEMDVENCKRLTKDQRKACLLLKEGNTIKSVCDELGWKGENKESNIERIKEVISSLL